MFAASHEKFHNVEKKQRRTTILKNKNEAHQVWGSRSPHHNDYGGRFFSKVKNGNKGKILEIGKMNLAGRKEVKASHLKS